LWLFLPLGVLASRGLKKSVKMNILGGIISVVGVLVSFLGIWLFSGDNYNKLRKYEAE